MAKSLQPGANLPLPSGAELRIGIAWEPERPGGHEADASAFLLRKGDQVGGDADFVFYNNPCSACGSLTLNQGVGPERQAFHIRLGDLPVDVAKIAICLTLHGRGSFAQARRIDLRIFDAARTELMSFSPPTTSMTEAALILGEIYRRNDQWKFRAVGQGFTGGLGPLATHFGVDIREETPTAPPPPVPRATAKVPPVSIGKAPATGVLPTASIIRHSAAADLDYEILYPGAYTLARVDLPRGRHLKAQSDAMVAMAPTIDVEGKMEGGLLAGLGRLMSGESFFLQTLTAARGPGSVFFAPASPSEVVALDLQPGDGYVIQKDGFLACSEEVQVSTQVQNIARGLFSQEGFFILKAEGRGLVFLESYGAIHEFDLQPGQQKIVDNGHLVAWSQSMRYELEMGNPGFIAAFTSGEKIVCRFFGPGRLLVQTRQPRQFGLWISRFLPG
ncbi:TIGR00266 family protein [Candidatus Competibacter phosphatis]|uniref:TIGR00266 family protein n=1 Tax=Candidatus Competibacter phosphatis TaxID=221280 RepID=A0ABX1THY9_9GAMM|nr:TIGR00266 family protein [Candidatus Competibacter phosphatis]NMQ18317.1 TIGR00266 family protein [Candidatus Competibacter phosphatis]